MKIPDFTLTHITHYDKKEASAKDFLGKWLILDFWSTTCASCIAGFPKVSELQAAFKDSVQFMLVGMNAVAHSGKNIEQLYERLREKRNLQISSAYDSVLAKKWALGGYPYMIIIDPQGIVRYLTTGSDLTKEKMRDIISGKTVDLYRLDAVKVGFDMYDLTGSKDMVICQSVLTKYNGEKFRLHLNMEEALTSIDHYKHFGLTGVGLERLYSFAYYGAPVDISLSPSDPAYGSISSKAALEVKNDSLFKTDFSGSVPTGLYNYGLILPKDAYERSRIMKIMQDDLKKAFGYNVSIETRKVQAIALTAQKGAATKLSAKGGSMTFEALEEGGGSSEGSKLTTFHGGFRTTNMPVAVFINNLKMYLGDLGMLFLNETGIKGNIDITLAADMTSLRDIKKALQQQGLDIVLVERPMKVLVISDPK